MPSNARTVANCRGGARKLMLGMRCLIRHAGRDFRSRLGGWRKEIVVAAELRNRVIKKDTSRLTAQLEAVPVLSKFSLSKRPSMPYMIRAHLERTGQLIGANDLLIAAH